ncbi:MAG TPA: M4 family metallopeptidase [Streptomyces sp.]|nr:M4 family metallopeptidase [Streptomyces sp.]
MVAVGATTGAATATPADSGAEGALTQHAAAIRAAQAAAPEQAKALGLDAQQKLVVRDVIKDKNGTVHTRYERTYDGMPVLGGDLVVHEKSNGKRSVTKATNAPIDSIATTAQVAVSSAKEAALGIVRKLTTGKAAAQQTDSARKVIWAADGTPRLAWETVVTGVQPDGTPSEMHVVTDATTGAKLFTHQAIETGTGTGDYNGTVELQTTPNGDTFDLKDGLRGGHFTTDLHQGTSGQGELFNDADDVWGGGRQSAAVDAHYGAAATWDFYKDAFGRNGIRNDGKGSYSRVHYGDEYVNAFWDDSCFCMTYGDGANNSNPLTSLDVAAHEMSHGVTSATAGLVYQMESGGLNEATSDIMATAVEFHTDNPADTPDYLIGEKIDINGDGTPLRYMDQPSRDGASADHWSILLKLKDVHYSSGPANHFFYLLSEGSGKKTINGVDYDSPTYNGESVTGIGIGKAQQIWYTALTEYMTSTTNYHDARDATLQAASDLYGAGSTEYQTVDAAWAAVNVT